MALSDLLQDCSDKSHIGVNIHFNQNFEKFGMKIDYHSIRGHLKISKIGKSACEMFQNVENI